MARKTGLGTWQKLFFIFLIIKVHCRNNKWVLSDQADREITCLSRLKSGLFFGLFKSYIFTKCKSEKLSILCPGANVTLHYAEIVRAL